MKTTPDSDTTAGAINCIPETIESRVMTKAEKRERWQTSSDGRWRTSKNHAGLMQFIPAGTYYARAKVRGKSVRVSLGTDVFATAKLRLDGRLKELKAPKADVGTFGDGRLRYESETKHGYTSRKKKLI